MSCPSQGKNIDTNNPKLRLSTPSVGVYLLKFSTWLAGAGSGKGAPRQLQIEEQDGPSPATHALCTSSCMSHLPFALVQGEKVLCMWGQGHDHAQHTDHARRDWGNGGHHILFRNSQRPTQIAFGHCPNLERTFFPQIIIKNFIQSHVLFSLTYRHTLPKRKTHLWVLGHKLYEVYFIIKYISFVLYECSPFTPEGL